jgi:RimJ/RimL family protein N-acetyltransferase
VRVFVRPDGRCFVSDVDPDALDRLDRDVYASAVEADVDRYLRLGFAVHRRERTYRLATAIGPAPAPSGVAVVHADEVDETDLRLLDDELRQDVPGTDGWRWEPAAFRDETDDSSYYDPKTYVVAVDERTGQLVGIARVWLSKPTPRLGFVGVRRSYRRRGIARALVAAAFAELERRGIAEVTTEIDETNVASRALLEPLGAEPAGTVVELVRRAAATTRSRT